MWSIDETEWEIPCTVERTAEMTSSEISGMLLDRSYFNDVIGTFMKYSIKIEVPFGMEDDYSALYEILTEPVDGHVFELPYAGGLLTVTGRVQNIKDVYVRMPGGYTHWKGITFEIHANHPSKYNTLSKAISLGVAPLPDESDVSAGASYIYSDSGWEELENAEDAYY